MMHRAAVRAQPPLLFNLSRSSAAKHPKPPQTISTALNVAAADVLQLNLNAESKETRARRKCPTLGSPTHHGPAQRCEAEAGQGDAMTDEERWMSRGSTT
ncbi:hypothetical protein PBY51_006930 [Eleginops maclovinus]|uniref:Uncharacterized protein n=1 Tax=Eleginops maclovinus TaxID=56733 RepID=A0AAN7WW22_ELEMC|nr:hypothetical protein PBY51_006930 [Eleginops maclovinus]